jgi:GNAT superfamily N-acetyltransferase
VIRLATPADTEFLARANERMALETEHKVLPPATIRAGVARVLADPQLGRYYVAECDGRPVGCLMITYEWSDWRNGLFWWVQSVFVEPEYRGRGIYRSLYQHVKQTAAAEGGCCGFRLYVETDNLGAQQTYQRLGMSPTDYLLFEEAWGEA